MSSMLPDMLSGMLPDWFARLGPVGWPLAVCTVTALTIVLERAIFLLHAADIRGRRFDGLADVLRRHRALPKPVRDEAAAIALDGVRRDYFAGTRLLRLIVAVAPILGLLGTVFGIISTFRVIAANTGPVSPNLIADGLWEAMLTTAVGLSIAVGAMLADYLVRSVAVRRLDGYGRRLNELSLRIEIERVHDGASAVRIDERSAA